MPRTRTYILVALLIACAASLASAQDNTATVIVNSDGQVVVEQNQSGFASLAFAAAGIPTTDFTVPPSVFSSRLGRRTITQNMLYICQDRNGQNVNCTIGLSLTAVAGSGGHIHHDNDRPKGGLSAMSGFTGTSGFATVFTAPEVSGVVELHVTLVFPPPSPDTPGQTVSFVQTFGITEPGLVPLPPGHYRNTGAKAGRHIDNHYGLPVMNGAVLLLADEYHALFSSQPGYLMLGYNDMSLEQGGLYDAYNPDAPVSTIWQPPHASHRFGKDIDIDQVTLPRENRRRLLAMANAFNLFLVPEATIHFRLR